jgi:CubicO group peptidase (beta-lactamase class C family)
MVSIENGRLTDNRAGIRFQHGRRRSAANWALKLVPAVMILSFAPTAQAQDAKSLAPSRSNPSIEQRVDAFVNLLEAHRKELGVTGAAVVIAHRDRIVRVTGLGLRNVESSEAVTGDTVFGVGSVTKQFTAMAVALAVSEGKMAFEDHPRRYVPAFRLQDPEADAGLNMIDLLAHRSGLDRSDVTWLLAPFSQAEMFELAYRAKPAAKLRERFLYNNTMYAVAGAAVAGAYQMTYERFMSERLLQPLGMQSSTLTLEGLTTSSNRAIGYADGATGGRKPVKPVDLASVAPAGALNSTARDLGAWLKFLNSRGEIDGARKIAPAAFARVFETHQQTGPSSSYGLGFFLHTRSGVLVAEHGGNVPGYTAQIAYVPERALSFALLTNQDNSRLAAIAQELFWETVVRPEIPAAATPPSGPDPKPERVAPTPSHPISSDLLIGQYFATGGGSFEVKKSASGLLAVFSGQPPYPLKAIGVDAYDLSGLSGYSLKFAESSAMPGRITAFLRQPPSHPGGNIDFLKKDDPWLARARAQHNGPEKELIGSYLSDDRALMMEIVSYRRGVALIITGQTPWPLVNISVDLFRLEGLPETYRVQIKRSSNNRVVGFTLQQPNLRQEMSVAASAVVGNAEQARDILERAVAAAGGASALDRIVTMTAFGRASAPTHGIDGRTEDQVSLGKRAELIELGAFGKVVIKFRQVTNEQKSLSVSYGSEPIVAIGKALEAARFFAVPHSLHRWKERFVTVAATGEAPVNGENAFVIELTPRGLAPSKLYISTESFLILREEIPTYVADTLQPASYGAEYSDYRVVNGIRMPFAVAITVPILGRIALTYESVSVDNPIDPKVFDAPLP